MAISKMDKGYLVSQDAPGPATELYSDRVVEHKSVPVKRTGSFIDFPNGSRFRRATAHDVYRSWVEWRTAQFTQSTKTTPPIGFEAFARSNLGGFAGGGLFQSPLSTVGKGGLSNRTSPPSIPIDLRNRVVTEALLDFVNQKASIGENLATYRQIVQMVVNPANSFWKLAKGLRQVGERKEFRRFLRQSARDLERKGLLDRAAEHYLQYVYGWKPLVADIYGTIEVLKGKSIAPLFLHSESTAKERSQSGPLKAEPPSNTTEVSGTDVDSHVRCSLWARIDPNAKGLRAMNQLGLVNPLSLAWELVPWSFVVDWFIPIGSTLQALSAPAGLSFVDGSISNRINARADFQTYWNKLHKEAWHVNSHVPATGIWKYEGYHRETFSNWPLPGFWIDPDPFRADRPLKALALAILGLNRLK